MSNPLSLHPIPWYDAYGSFPDIFIGLRAYNLITPTECALPHPSEPTANDLNHTTFKLSKSGLVGVMKPNAYNFPQGATISKFTLLSAVRFKHDHAATISYIQYELMGVEIPYIRVGCDYFKIIKKETRFGGTETIIKGWKKDEIKQDHSKQLLSSIPKFDDFIIQPDNKNFKPVLKNCYNLYSEFQHIPHDKPVTAADIPITLNFIKHIFQEQFEMGLTYFKCLYEHPKQLLPILCLVSAENETGKTTFLNFLSMIFSGNYSTVSPEDLLDKFNSIFATKNIIAAEETFFEKGSGVDKLKYLSTAEYVWLALKFREKEQVPFFGKFILNTNKVKDFMRIDEKEIRFWIREIPKIPGKKNNLIESQLFKEIPKFLKFLIDLPPIDFNTGSRMLFTKEQLQTEQLTNVKNESRSGLLKDIEILITDFFDQHPAIKQFHASATDIKERWFKNNNQPGFNAYIFKVLKDEAGLHQCKSNTGKSIKYYAFADEINPYSYKTGTPFEFFRSTEPDPEPSEPF